MHESEKRPAIEPAPEGEDGSSNEKTFDFFGLPPELRNMIYPLLTNDTKIEEGWSSEGLRSEVDVIVQNKLLPSLLLINQQFKQEYESTVLPEQVLIFNDKCYGLSYVELDDITRKTTQAIVRLIADCEWPAFEYDNCGFPEDLNEHVHWIQNTFEQLTQLQSVKIELHP